MEARASSSSAAADAYPRWVLLEQSNTKSYKDPDARTVAFARTSRGHPFGVSFQLAPPPASSGLCVHSGPGLPDGVKFFPQIIAAHGDSVLVEIMTEDKRSRYVSTQCTADFFVYSAGDAAADPSRPPSLSLLPSPMMRHHVYANAIGLLRRGGEELLVAWMLVGNEGADEKREHPVEDEAKLGLLRSGEWEVKQLPISHDEGKQLSFWHTETVVPVGDRFLCWVDLNRGVIFADMSDETPELRYVSLPVKDKSGSRSCSMRVCATGGDGVVRFVDVSPRCCCGGPGYSTCARSLRAFTVTTWTLRTDNMTWDKDGVVLDSDELWGFSGYVDGVIPRVRAMLPMVSLDDPGVLYLVVQKHPHQDDDVTGDEVPRLIEVDTRRKELRSIVCYNDRYFRPSFVPSKLSSYFNINTPASKQPEAP